MTDFAVERNGQYLQDTYTNNRCCHSVRKCPFLIGSVARIAVEQKRHKKYNENISKEKGKLL